jgi:hypothetical protein
MEKKIVKNTKQLINILSELSITEARAFAFLIFNEKPHHYFKITYKKINRSAGVSNSYICMKELIKKGLIKKRSNLKGNEWMITVDLVESE